jgi:capsular polysaccharide transport system ATP-binding protein
LISLSNICKGYKTRKGRRTVLDHITRDFPPGINVGILGRNGAGKSTLLRIIGGSEIPDSGTVARKARISWPIGFAGGFNAKLSGRENLRFICRLYNEDYNKVCDFVEDFSELGEYMDMPVFTYSSGMRAKINFGASMAFNFDYYLIDEVTAVGDASFKKKSERLFQERRKNATLIMVSHSMGVVRALCDRLLVLHEGKLREFDSPDAAVEFYNDVCNRRIK